MRAMEVETGIANHKKVSFETVQIERGKGHIAK
jgi:hypothetical protein